MEQISGTKETDTTIWKSTRKRAIRKRVQQFLFKTIHNAYMIGYKWSNIPGFEARASCPMCKETESMRHILIDCYSIAHHLVWAKAKELWPHGQQAWPDITIGTIMGIGSITLPENQERGNDNSTARSMKSKGRTRLLQIIISEASHLTWVLRCERAIRGTKHSPTQIKARWMKVINNRLTTDRITATKIKREKSFSTLVNETWKEALKQKNIYHRNWLQRREVFSG